MVKLRQSGEYNNRRQLTLAMLFKIAALLDVLPSKLATEKLVIK
jgi:hypothetical protein